jgi:hypothetical protein
VERLPHGVERLRLCFRQVAGKITQKSLFGKASFIAVEHDAGMAGGVGYVLAKAV